MENLIYSTLTFLLWTWAGTVTFVLLTLWSLWILYVAMMNINAVSQVQSLPWQSKLLVYPTVVVFEIVELIANILVCTLIFLDFPQEWTVSERLRRYKRNPERAGWRMLLVKFIKPMLDPFDPTGPHI